jgi:hypothetical protein
MYCIERIKVIFPVAAGVRVNAPITCIALDRTVFSSAYPGCEAGTEPDGSPYVMVANLVANSPSYYFNMQDIVNAASA